jgi:hypothetical protein
MGMGKMQSQKTEGVQQQQLVSRNFNQQVVSSAGQQNTPIFEKKKFKDVEKYSGRVMGSATTLYMETVSGTNEGKILDNGSNITQEEDKYYDETLDKITPININDKLQKADKSYQQSLKLNEEKKDQHEILKKEFRMNKPLKKKTKTGFKRSKHLKRKRKGKAKLDPHPDFLY